MELARAMLLGLGTAGVLGRAHAHLRRALPVEEEVEGASDAPRPIKFRQGGRSAEGRAARRAASIRASRMAALRAGGVALVLIYLTYRAILWVETQDYGQFLNFMHSNG